MGTTRIVNWGRRQDELDSGAEALNTVHVREARRELGRWERLR